MLAPFMLIEYLIARNSTVYLTFQLLQKVVVQTVDSCNAEAWHSSAIDWPEHHLELNVHRSCCR